MYILEVNEKTLFTKFSNVYDECSFLINDLPKAYQLMCLKTDCPRNANCMEKLAKRVKAIFDSFPNAQLLILYYKYRDSKSLKAGVFWREMDEPKLITMNPGAWEKMKELGVIYEWEMPTDLLLGK